MKLFWLTSIIKTEDWFVVAETKRKAERFFEDAEGFGKYEGKAKNICNISNDLISKYEIEKEEYPRHELIKDLGGIFHSEDVPRIVNFNGNLYIEGHLTYISAFEQIGEKPGVYIVRFQNTETYKIGITKKLKKRISQLSTGSPHNIMIEYFIATEHYKSLEKHFHKIFKNHRVKGEWFRFNKEEFYELECHLSVLQKSDSFFVYNIKGLYQMLY